MPALEKALEGLEVGGRRRGEPLWKGPEVDGVTQSMLSRFLVCRERFRLHVMEGLRPADQFNHRLEYGQMWHTCEESLAANPGKGWHSDSPWLKALQAYCQALSQRYKLAGADIDKWYNVCKVQFPLYVEHWSKHPDVKDRTPLLQEQVFDVPYELPSGRTVRLRGKWDSVDLIGKGKAAGVYLQENKTKGGVNEGQLKRQLSFDLQTMLYLVALERWRDKEGGIEDWGMILGVRYNVVRRPLSGGKGSIVQHKPSKSNPAGESKEDYYARLAQYIKDEPETYFMRWKVEVTPGDVAKFRTQCLDPILEQLCWWHDHVANPGWSQEDPGLHDHPPVNWRHPFGVYNVLDEGGSSELDEYLATGSEVGLTRADKLFEELT